MSATSVDRLRRFVNRSTDHSSCDLCRSELAAQHRHLLEVANRKMLCACDACALLFSDTNGSRFRPIPQSVTRVDLKLSDAEWNGLGIPIGMAFFTVREHEIFEPPSLRALVSIHPPSGGSETSLRVSGEGPIGNSGQQAAANAPSPRLDSTLPRESEARCSDTNDTITVAYPSPAGPVMSSVETEDWQTLVDANPQLRRLRPEVESLLINRTASHHQSFIVPLDVCFELIGIVRRHWKGVSGGPDVHRAIDRFFDQLDESAAKGVPS